MAIRFTSFLGDNALNFYGQVVDYLSKVTGFSTELVSDLSPERKEAMVCREDIQVVFTCGLPYVHKADCDPPRLRLLAAPVLAAERYRGRAVYFSDVIVRAEAPYHTFADLSGAVFAYNETHSFSGYIAPCWYLRSLGKTERFFRELVKSGAHAVSMDWVEQGRAEAAAIDSMVLEMELLQRPDRVGAFRVIEQIGPYPMPPIAAVTGLPEPLYQALSKALLRMHLTETGGAILRPEQIRHFAAVTDRDYDPIRQVLRDLEQIGMPARP